MGELINLRQYKKGLARQEKAQKASENRVRYGHKKPDVLKQLADAEKARRELDGMKRDE